MDATITNPVLQRRELVDRMLKRVNTAIPGRIDSFDPNRGTCSVTPAVQARTFINGASADVTLPQLQDVPLWIDADTGNGLLITRPVLPGQPCLLVVSQRCIDNWWANGDVQSAEAGGIGARHHDLNDAIAFPLGSPLPFAQTIQDWCQDGIEVRNLSRTVRITLRNGGIEVEGDTTFLSPTHFMAPVDFQSTFTDRMGIEHTVHLHGNVMNGGGKSGKPVQ